MTASQRTLVRLRQLGYAAEVVERWMDFPKPNAKPGDKIGFRRDLFGIIDIVAVKRGESGVLGVQATTIACCDARIQKAKTKYKLEMWLRAHNRFEVWAWYKLAGNWEPKIVALSADSMDPVVTNPRRRKTPRRQVQGDLW